MYKSEITQYLNLIMNIFVEIPPTPKLLGKEGKAYDSSFNIYLMNILKYSKVKSSR